MTHTLRFLGEVEDDAAAAYAWYEARSRGLGEEFLRMFYARAGEIPQNPLLYPVAYGHFRRCLLRRFPYAVYFRVEGTEVVVFGLFHCARDPRAIRKKLQDREEPAGR